MAPDEVFSYIPTPEHPSRLRQMLPIDAQEGLALLAYYRNSFVNACTKKDQNTADCILDIVIHLRYRLIKLGEFLEDPSSSLFAIYYEQTLPCMIYGTPLKIDFSPACDLTSLIAEIDIDEGIEIADDVEGFVFGDIDMSQFDVPTVQSVKSVETKKGKRHAKLPPKVEPNNDDDGIKILPPKVEKMKSKKLKNNFYPDFASPLEHLPNLNEEMSKARNRYLLTSTAKYVAEKNAGTEDLGDIECDIWDCLGDLVVCSRGKEAVKLLEVMHPVEVVEDGTIRVTKQREKVGYEAIDYCFRGCPSSRDWLLTRRL
uniref:Uncharacterized protein n=1 Tax=Osugoroshi virus TaxID=2202814 RepID=A0A7R7T1P8_9VIRU|nr:hypothetical protein [Osugoroshi virus]